MSQLDVLLDLLSDGAIRQMRQISEAGITAATVQRAVGAGQVRKVSRGAYQKAGIKSGYDSQLAAASMRVPRGLVCLHSAAFVSGLARDRPDRVWIGLPTTVAALPRVDWPLLQHVRFRNALAFSVGVETRVIAGVAVSLTTPARTVIDMLRLSEVVDYDAALVCLRSYLRRGLPDGELHAIATELGWDRRIAPVIRIAAALV